MSIFDFAGVLAGICVVLSSYSTDFARLRRFSIASNILFVVYATSQGLWPLYLLHALLLPLNLIRLSQLSRFAD